VIKALGTHGFVCADNNFNPVSKLKLVSYGLILKRRKLNPLQVRQCLT